MITKQFKLINVVRVDTGTSLKVGFFTENGHGTRKVYYCSPLLEEKAFEELHIPAPQGTRNITLDFHTKNAQQVVGWQIQD